MPAGYAATTEVESTYGDAFSYEISDLRVAESLPYPTPAGGTIHVEPAARLQPLPSTRTRRPSNIIPIRPAGDPTPDIFYLGLDVLFVGTELGKPSMPVSVDLEVRFFLEAYGTATGALAGHRHEINIQPQTFMGLNTDPTFPGPDKELRHQLWVQVAEADLANIIAAPPGQTWEDLFNPNTIYRIAASVKIVGSKLRPPIPPYATGFIEGAVFQTEEWNAQIVVP